MKMYKDLTTGLFKEGSFIAENTSESTQRSWLNKSCHMHAIINFLAMKNAINVIEKCGEGIPSRVK